MSKPPYQLSPFGEGRYSPAEFHEELRDMLGGRCDGTNTLGDNLTRAAWAAEAVYTFAKRTGMANDESIHVTIGDLLGDIRHLLDFAAEAQEDDRTDGSPTTFADLAERSAMHYNAEIRGEL